MIEIREVEDKRGLSEFIKLPFSLYKDNPYWVPPLISEMRNLLSEKNPFFEHAEAKLFLAFKEGKPVGRIAAIVDKNYIDFQKEKTGFFGFFECVEDFKVAESLFSQAKKWLREKGMEHMLGPMNPSTNDECGFLLEGFDSSPMIMMPYTYKYYLDYAEGFGLRKAKDLFAYYRYTKDPPPEKLLRILNKVEKNKRIKVRPVNLKNLKEDAPLIKTVYNSAWAQNFGFVPLTDKEFDLMVKRLKPLVIPDFVPLAFVDGEIAGVALGVPDYNQVLKRLGGKLGPLEIVKLLWYSRKIRDVRLMVLGVRPEYRKMGIDALLYWEIFKTAEKRRYRGGELSWVLEDNYLTNRAIQMWGGKLYKKYRLYQMEI